MGSVLTINENAMLTLAGFGLLRPNDHRNDEVDETGRVSVHQPNPRRRRLSAGGHRRGLPVGGLQVVHQADAEAPQRPAGSENSGPESVDVVGSLGREGLAVEGGAGALEQEPRGHVADEDQGHQREERLGWSIFYVFDLCLVSNNRF